MQALFRPTSPADGPALAAFLGEAFKDDPAHPAFDAAQFHWKYWQARADGPASRSFVLARGDDILAHAGVVPGCCVWDGGRLDTLHLIEWAARPGALGAGAALLKHIARTTDALLAIGGNARTLAMLPALGFRRCGDATPFIRSLRPLRLVTGAPSLSWRLAFKVARGVVWNLGTRDRIDSQWQTSRVAAEDLADMPLTLPGPRAGAAVMARSAAMFRYLLSCPATTMSLHRVDKTDGRTRGYFMLAFAPGQARLADCWVDSDDPADWRAAVQLAVLTAKEDRGVAEVAALANDAALSAALVDCGFRARPTQVVQMLTKPGVAVPTGPPHVQMLDNDAAWLHAGRRRA